MNLDSPINAIKGIGDKLVISFTRLNITTVGELINYYPKRYDDYSLISKISKLRPGPCTLEVQISHVSGRYGRRGMHITEAIARDDHGSVRLIWFNQPYRATSIKIGTDYFVSGNYELSHQRFSLINPSIELKSDFPINTARLVPKYSETKGLASREIRKALKQVSSLISSLNETLPKEIINNYHLISLSQAIRIIHFPDSMADLDTAKRRLGFEELMSIIMASLLNKQLSKSERSHAVD